MKVVSVATMRELEARAMAAGVTEVDLMGNAGLAAAQAARRFCQRRIHQTQLRRITVVAGKGNNGGDALVAARYFATHGDLPVTVYGVVPKEAYTGSARHHASRLPPQVAYHQVEALPPEALAPGGLILDGLLGTGATGAPRQPYDTLIQQINTSHLPVVALDIPSGLDADSGHAAGAVITADLTVTLGLPKRGLLTAEGLARCGALRCVKIGIPAEMESEITGCGEAFFARDASALLPRRPHEAHKGIFGHTLVIGGSAWYAGAPMLAGEAALRAGGGVVTVAVPATIRPLVSSVMRALILRALPDAGSGFLDQNALSELETMFATAQAVVFGPGVTPREPGGAVLARVLQASVPVVIDADGLRLLARNPTLAERRTAPTVITPHPGEMRALLNGFGLERLLNAPRSQQAAEFARQTGLHVILKGQGTLVTTPDGGQSQNTSGTNGLATAGTGDVLAGILGSLLGQGMPVWDALRLGTFIHGAAAELAPHGNRSLVADDLLCTIGMVFNRLTPFA